MKMCLIAISAFIGLSAMAHADDFRPADEWAQLEERESAGAADAIEDEQLEMDAIAPFPGRRPPPRPFPPRPPRPYPPRPYPPYPPYPAPPTQRVYDCGASDVYGRDYWERGYDPRWTQQQAHNTCVYQSNGPCRDLGCRVW